MLGCDRAEQRPVAVALTCAQHLHELRKQHQGSTVAVLGLAQSGDHSVQVDMLPLKAEQLALSCAGQYGHQSQREQPRYWEPRQASNSRCRSEASK